MAKSSFDLKSFARVGAQQRLRELEEERRAILAAFPELRSSGTTGARRRRGRPRSVDGPSRASSRPRRKRFTMSAEARKRISEAQKARWAKVRKAKSA